MIEKQDIRPRAVKIAFFTGLVLVALLLLSFALQLEIPAPTGPYPVGQTKFRWVDSSRPEVLTENPDDVREVIALVWYPAEKGTATTSPYFPELSRVSKALSESGEVKAWQVFGLQFVRSHNLLNANPEQSGRRIPLVIFSPGNATNIEFYPRQ